MSEPTGQILPESRFGQWLTRLARSSLNIVEIGTWRGGGSTACIVAGLHRPEQRFYAVELDKAMLDEAKSRHNDPRIIWLQGSVSREEGKDWPIVIDRLPERIDLLLIDGGETCGRSDFLALWERCRVIALDDTKELKNRENAEQMKHGDWRFIAGNRDERNGWAIYARST